MRAASPGLCQSRHGARHSAPLNRRLGFKLSIDPLGNGSAIATVMEPTETHELASQKMETSNTKRKREIMEETTKYLKSG